MAVPAWPSVPRREQSPAGLAQSSELPWDRTLLGGTPSPFAAHTTLGVFFWFSICASFLSQALQVSGLSPAALPGLRRRGSASHRATEQRSSATTRQDLPLPYSRIQTHWFSHSFGLAQSVAHTAMIFTWLSCRWAEPHPDPQLDCQPNFHLFHPQMLTAALQTPGNRTSLVPTPSLVPTLLHWGHSVKIAAHFCSLCLGRALLQSGVSCPWAARAQ